MLPHTRVHCTFRWRQSRRWGGFFLCWRTISICYRVGALSVNQTDRRLHLCLVVGLIYFLSALLAFHFPSSFFLSVSILNDMCHLHLLTLNSCLIWQLFFFLFFCVSEDNTWSSKTNNKHIINKLLLLASGKEPHMLGNKSTDCLANDF